MNNTATAARPLSARTQFLLILLLAFTTAALVYGGWLAFQEQRNIESTIPSAGPKTEVDAPDLTRLMATALHHGGQADLHHTIGLRHPDNRPFRQNLTNIAAKNGWLIYRSTSSQIKLVIPENEVSMLNTMEQDPVAWTLWARAAPVKRQHSPQTLRTVSIGIEKKEGKYEWLHFLTAIAFTAAFFTTVCTLGLIAARLRNLFEDKGTQK